MFTSPAHRKSLILLLCGVLLLMQVVGAHLHLCLDGQEPPASVHLFDGGSEHFPGLAASQHHDRDVDTGSATLGKKTTADLDSPPVAHSAFALWDVQPRLTLAQDRGDDHPVHYSTTRLLPPLRGPPKTTLT
jgi:hypothetical protein